MIPFLRPDLLQAEDVAYCGEVLRRLRRDEDTVTTMSGSAKADFWVHTGFDLARVHVAPLAADPQRFRPGDRAGTLRRPANPAGGPGEIS